MKVQPTAILVAEDDFNDQLLIRNAFKKINCAASIFLVNNGREAIEYLNGDGSYSDRERHPFPSAIITDLKMPESDGFAVLEHLRNNPQWGVIPAIVLTSSRDLDDINRAYLLGATAYHVKPSDPVQLRDLLHAFNIYWSMVEIPRRNRNGDLVPTNGSGKLGERFLQPL